MRPALGRDERYESLQSHRSHVTQSRDWGREPHPLASAGGFQVVQEDDHRPGHRHGAQNFESIGKPLPNRTTIVLTRSAIPIPGVEIASELDQIDPANPAFKGRDVFICGGAQIYQLALPRCSDLYLTQVKRTVDGDTFFPAFEESFEMVEAVMDRPEFKVLHFRRKGRNNAA
jgi:hypothetical protein